MTCSAPTKIDPCSRFLRAGARVAALTLAGTLLAGCSIKMRAGQDPDLSALESDLIPAESTPGQIRATLGRHYGEGRALMPFHDEPREVLTYYYEEGTLEDDRRIFLFVFLHQGKYEGYMWFSSLEAHK